MADGWWWSIVVKDAYCCTYCVIRMSGFDCDYPPLLVTHDSHPNGEHVDQPPCEIIIVTTITTSMSNHQPCMEDCPSTNQLHEIILWSSTESESLTIRPPTKTINKSNRLSLGRINHEPSTQNQESTSRWTQMTKTWSHGKRLPGPGADLRVELSEEGQTVRSHGIFALNYGETIGVITRGCI